ncbi:efflux RND transporter permease subunit, partial [Acinetobacter baumannii]
EVATDVMPPGRADLYVMLKPQQEWPNPHKPKAQLLTEIEVAANSLPGTAFEFSQPVQMRMNELISGVRSDVAVKVFGDDLGELLRVAGR